MTDEYLKISNEVRTALTPSWPFTARQAEVLCDKIDYLQASASLSTMRALKEALELTPPNHPSALEYWRYAIENLRNAIAVTWDQVNSLSKVIP